MYGYNPNLNIIDLVNHNGTWMAPWDVESPPPQQAPWLEQADTVDSKSATGNSVEVQILSGPPVLDMDGDKREVARVTKTGDGEGDTVSNIGGETPSA